MLANLEIIQHCGKNSHHWVSLGFGGVANVSYHIIMIWLFCTHTKSTTWLATSPFWLTLNINRLISFEECFRNTVAHITYSNWLVKIKLILLTQRRWPEIKGKPNIHLFWPMVLKNVQINSRNITELLSLKYRLRWLAINPHLTRLQANTNVSYQ